MLSKLGLMLKVGYPSCWHRNNSLARYRFGISNFGENSIAKHGMKILSINTKGDWRDMAASSFLAEAFKMDALAFNNLIGLLPKEILLLVG